MKILIRNGHVIDPDQDIDEVRDILVEDGKVRAYYPANKGPRTARVLDASGRVVVPGLVDIHTHLREPGYEYKETIESGTKAAVRGGFTSVCCMPNTNPVNDNIAVTEFIVEKAREEAACSVYPIGAITKGQKGEELTEIDALKKTGCVAFSDDGRPVVDSLIMRRALEYSKIFDVPIIAHCEDLFLSEGGVMNEGFVSTIVGLKGIPRAAEEIMVARDIALCELTGGRLHIAHVSSEQSVRYIRHAKERGLNITAETCPHYFSLTDESLISYDTNLKVNPPVRTGKDVLAIKEGLKDGTIDVIATDHAPHHVDDKNKEFDAAAFGISGLETAFALSLQLVHEGVLSLKQLISKMTLIPSQIIGISKGSLAVDADADMAIINLERTFEVDTKTFLSKGKNSPFKKWGLKGYVEKTVAKGTVYEWD